MANNSVLPLVAIIVVAVALIAIAYANITGMFQISGAELIDSTTAFVVVTVLFLAMLPWVWRRAKSS